MSGVLAHCSQGPEPASLIVANADQASMGKLDRAVGAMCIALAGFAAIAGVIGMRASASQPSWLVGLSGTPALVTIILSLLAAIPGFVLVFRKGTI
jgi:uncharacterized protein (DUF983 family)